jgi:hypothetical protein
VDRDHAGTRDGGGAVGDRPADAAGRDALCVQAAGWAAEKRRAERKYERHCHPPKNWDSSIHLVVSRNRQSLSLSTSQTIRAGGNGNMTTDEKKDESETR